jgi:hypothetical protein
VPIRGWSRNAQCGRSLLDIQASEVSQLDQFEYHGVFPFEFVERLVNGKQLVGRCVNSQIDGVNVEALSLSDGFCRPL